MPDSLSLALPKTELRVLSLWQPWASLMAIGAKKFETRSWQTKYRGWVAIHAAAKWNRDLHGLCRAQPFRSALHQHNAPEDLPLGKVVAVGRLHAIIEAAKFQSAMSAAPYEFEFGDYTAGRFAWNFQDVRELPLPIPLKASQGLFHAPELLRHQIIQQCPDLNLV